MTPPDRPEPPAGLVVLHDDETLVVSFPLPEAAARGAEGSLTPAECAVVVDLLAGFSNAEIAQRRGTRPRTVANQIARIFAKLGVRSRLELLTRMPMSR